jgi:hypothetical protein
VQWRGGGRPSFLTVVNFIVRRNRMICPIRIIGMFGRIRHRCRLSLWAFHHCSGLSIVTSLGAPICYLPPWLSLLIRRRTRNFYQGQIVFKNPYLKIPFFIELIFSVSRTFSGSGINQVDALYQNGNFGKLQAFFLPKANFLFSLAWKHL